MTNRLIVATVFLFASLVPPLAAQNAGKAEKKKQKKQQPHSWVSPLPDAGAKWLKGLSHGTFESSSMGVEVGFHIYLPPSYETNSDARFPVVYHLHGGRPGAESKSVRLSKFVDTAIRKEEIKPVIYVFPNGGPMSWYNMPNLENAMGEDVFVNELVPHINATFRTTGKQSLEGFSQGGRGTTRIMFKHPQLWASAAPGGSGYGPEMTIRDNNGFENPKLQFLPIGYNAWDLAKKFAEAPNRPALPILLWVGTKGFNYETNLQFSNYLDELSIVHGKLVVADAKHSAQEIYEAKGLELMKFHQESLFQ